MSTIGISGDKEVLVVMLLFMLLLLVVVAAGTWGMGVGHKYKHKVT